MTIQSIAENTVALALVAALAMPDPAAAQPWETNPANWANNPANWDNNPANWANNPANWANNPSNLSRSNGLYDNTGRSAGYITTTPSGTVNIWSNDGRRLGYGVNR